MGFPVYSKSKLPRDFAEASGTFRKKVLTRAIRIVGSFTVETSEGPLFCEDGWLALDARGYPYPIDAEEFYLIYEDALLHIQLGFES